MRPCANACSNIGRNYDVDASWILIVRVTSAELMHRCRGKAIIVCVALTLLAGCSAIQLGYSQADILLAWTANSYFDLNAEQKRDFDRRIDKLLAWHRREQLPEYVHFFSAIKERTQRPVTRDDAVWVFEGFKERFRTVVRHGADDAVEMLATLNADNIHALEQEWIEANRKFVREYHIDDTPQERHQARLKRTLKTIRDWTGSLTHEQEERIATLARAIPDSDPLRHQDRVRRQKEFRALLELRHNKTDFASRLRDWMPNWEQGRTPEYEKTFEEAYEKRIALYVDLARLLTPQQRAHVQNKLQNYINDMKALSAKHTASN